MPYYTNEPPFFATLNAALQSCTVDWLKRLAAALSDDKAPTRKAELIAFIEQQLAGDGLRTAWERLDEIQKAAVAEVAHGSESLFRADQFAAKYGKLPNWGKATGRWSGIYQPSLLSVFFIERVMPQDLRQRLAGFVPEPVKTSLRSVNEPPETITQTFQVWTGTSNRASIIEEDTPVIRREMERAAIHDLQAVLQLIDTGKLAISDKTRLPGKAGIKAITALLLDGDFYDTSQPASQHLDEPEEIGPIRAFAWPLLVQAGGLATPSGKTLTLSKAGRKAMGEPPENVLCALWSKWQKTTLLDELNRIDCIKGQSGKGKRGLTAVKGRRQAIEAALQDCEPEHWIAVDDFFRYMIASGIDFEVTRNPWTLYISDANYGNLGYEGYHDWKILQARYALCLLFEYAATLGMIDVAFIAPHGARRDYSNLWGTDDLDFLSRYDGLLYFRLTPLGAYCLGLRDSYQPSAPLPQARLRVLPNLDVVVAGKPLSPADELLLNSFLSRKSDAVWHLDRNGLLAALEEGRDLKSLRDFLEASSADPLPATVAQFLQDAEQRVRQLQDRGLARLIECADPALAALIANDSRTRRYCLRAGESHLAVFAADESRFRNAVRKLGYSLPK